MIRKASFTPIDAGAINLLANNLKSVTIINGDALESNILEEVNISEYTYPGPKPQSPETALLMLADGCEAKSKADNPSTTEEIDKIVRFIINRRLKHGQLDECDLSLTDLGKVRESFVTTLRGYYHNRLKYPPERRVEEPLVEDLDQSIEISDTKTSDQ